VDLRLNFGSKLSRWLAFRNCQALDASSLPAVISLLGSPCWDFPAGIFLLGRQPSWFAAPGVARKAATIFAIAAQIGKMRKFADSGKIAGRGWPMGSNDVAGFSG
jgi:hypothetical protein